MKENVEPVPDVCDFQQELESATDEEALSLFSNIEFDMVDDINEDSDAKNVAETPEADTSDSDSQQSSADSEAMMTQVKKKISHREIQMGKMIRQTSG